MENELLKKLETERAALRLEQWRHAATEVARLTPAAERDETRVKVLTDGTSSCVGENGEV